MKINVIYKTKTGKSEVLANIVAKMLNVKAIDINRPHTLEETDLLFIGAGVYGGKVDNALLDYIDNLPSNKIKGAAIFTTSFSGNDHSELLVNILKQKGIQVFPLRFSCKKRVFIFNLKSPDEVDKKNLENFVSKVLNSINK